MSVKYAKDFPPVESDPELFTRLLHQLGASHALHFEDVFSLDDPSVLSFIQGRIMGFVLISPSDDEYEASLARVEEHRMASLTDQDRETAKDVVWVKQTIHNACGFYALLHTFSNIPSAQAYVAPGSVLDTFLKAPSEGDRRKVLETSKALDDAYIPIALAGQSVVSDDWSTEVPWHYVAFAQRDGRVWELNGGRLGPVDRGTGEMFEVVKSRVEEYGDGAQSLLALVKND